MQEFFCKYPFSLQGAPLASATENTIIKAKRRAGKCPLSAFKPCPCKAPEYRLSQKPNIEPLTISAAPVTISLQRFA